MKVRSLKIAVIAGIFATIGKELELPETVAKKYIKAGFVEPIGEPVLSTEDEPPASAEVLGHRPDLVIIDDIVETPAPEIEAVSLRPLESFAEKEELEAYGKDFGINLNRSKKLENMYADLVAHVGNNT